MKCENYLCLYWKDDKCICNEIELDISGMCKSCIYFVNNDKKLDEFREKELNRIG